ncbi:hypothetical protein DWY99_08515 [[Clostridium] leptum]|uniref:Uncharacterized protein n=1 Tax=[Clostridium] leptum TaxID=1535 RepID=A0A412AWH6_9FIRM|nr:hypothetical protein DWY99_08515 [[Clostridium] leptum]
MKKRREDQFRQMRADETGREIRRKIGNVKETIGQDSKKGCARKKSGASKGCCAFERSVWRLLSRKQMVIRKRKRPDCCVRPFFTFSSGYH